MNRPRRRPPCTCIDLDDSQWPVCVHSREPWPGFTIREIPDSEMPPQRARADPESGNDAPAIQPTEPPG